LLDDAPGKTNTLEEFMSHGRVFRWVLSLALLASTAGAQGPPPPTFSSEVELVTVDAVVVDDDGRPVPGLTRDDFVIEAEGRVQEIATFEASTFDVTPARAQGTPASPTSGPAAAPGTAGRRFALVVDDAELTSEEVKGVVRALRSFFERDLRDGDEATLWTTSGDAWWSARIPEGRADLLAMVGRLQGRGASASLQADFISDYEAFGIVNYEGGNLNGPLLKRVSERWLRMNVCATAANPRAEATGGQVGGGCLARVKARAADVNADRQRRLRRVLSTVERATVALSAVRGRKSLLLLCRGFLADPGVDTREVQRAAREANAAVHFIDARGLTQHGGLPGVAEAGPAPDPSQVGSMGFESLALTSTGARDLAEETGGFSIQNTNDLAGAASRVATEARAYYLLGFYPPEGTKAGVWRKLKVSVKRKGLEVRARRGFALREPSALAHKPGQKDEATARALLGVHELTEIPLRAMVYVREPKSKEATRVLVLAELDAKHLTFEPSGKQRVARVELTVLATHRDTGRAIGKDTRTEVKLAEGEAPGWRALSHELELPAGVSQVRVIAVDPVTKRVGAVAQRVEVPPTGTLHLATPVLTNQLAPAVPGEPPEPALTVHRVFRPEGFLYCRLEVFGAARASDKEGPQVALGLEVRDADGLVVRQNAPTRVATSADGRVVRTLGIGLGDLKEGVYDLVLQVHDAVSGQRVERRESFTLAREEARN
jgi:VWFA-related protein